MSEQLKYLVTVDADSGTTLKLERIGEAGELTEVPASTLSQTAPAAAPTPPMVYNIFIGGTAPPEAATRPATISTESGAATQSVYPTCPGGHRKTVVGVSPVVGNEAADSAARVTGAQQAE